MVRAERRLVDRQGATMKKFGFRMTIRGLQQQRQVVQTCGYPRMVRSARRLVDHQGATIQRLGP